MKIVIRFLLATILLSVVFPFPVSAADDFDALWASLVVPYQKALEALEQSEKPVCDIPIPTPQQSEACGRIREQNNKKREILKKQFDERLIKKWEEKVEAIKQNE